MTLTHDFLIGQYEVSNQEYLAAVQWAWVQGLLTISEDGEYVCQYGQDLLGIDELLLIGARFNSIAARSCFSYKQEPTSMGSPAQGQPIQKVMIPHHILRSMSLGTVPPATAIGAAKEKACRPSIMESGIRQPATTPTWPMATDCQQKRSGSTRCGKRTNVPIHGAMTYPWSASMQTWPGVWAGQHPWAAILWGQHLGLA